MGAPIPIVLQAEEREEYQRVCRSSGKTSVRVEDRLAIVLLAADGLNNGEIAQQLSISAHTAGRWRKRFAEKGLPGLDVNDHLNGAIPGSVYWSHPGIGLMEPLQDRPIGAT